MAEDSSSPTALALQVLDLVRTRSLKRDEVDWAAADARLRERAEGCTSIEDAHRMIRELLRWLEDGHSFLRTTADMENRQSAPISGIRFHQDEPVVIDVPSGSEKLSVGDRVLSVDDEVVRHENWRRLRSDAVRVGSRLLVEQEAGRSEVKVPGVGSAAAPAPTGRLVAEGIALLDLPGHDGDGWLGDGRTYPAVVSELLVENDGVHGWIVDLRRCDGGNMWPMLAGLVPLLGIGHYGSFVDPVDGVWYDWGCDGNLLATTNRSDPEERYVMAELPEWRSLWSQDAPVALLTSGVTSSSGEAVLISFLGRLRTRTFGQPTGGLTTSNNLHVLLDGSWLLLAETLEADRLDTIYRGRLEPDEPVDIDWRKLGTADDPVIAAAVAWLRTQGHDVGNTGQ